MTYKVQIDDTVREATSQEIELIELQRQQHVLQVAAIEAVAAAKSSARTKLAALGLTDEEINAFLGA